MQQKQTFAQNTKILQHKLKKKITNARFGHLIRPPAWKQSKPYSAAPGANTERITGDVSNMQSKQCAAVVICSLQH